MYLVCGDEYLGGAILFSCGPLLIKFLGYNDFLGSSWRIRGYERVKIISILLGNIIGVVLMTILFLPLQLEIEMPERDMWNSIMWSILCGFLIPISYLENKNFWIPFISIVPVVILGLPLYTLDIQYLILSGSLTPVVIRDILLVCLGNFIGCNLWRLRKESSW